jgi:hypothetical protein
LFAYHPFADTAENLFCNSPGHYTGEIMRYGDSMVVSDSGNTYRISKLGENIWRPFPLPATVTLTTCEKDIFSRYFVTKSQIKGCFVLDSIKIEIVDLKTRKSVALLDKADYQYPIDYRAYQDKLFVSLGREGIAVYDDNLGRRIFQHQDCGTTGLAKERPKIQSTGPSLRSRSLNGRKRTGR